MAHRRPLAIPLLLVQQVGRPAWHCRTALLGYAVEAAREFRIVRTSRVQSEMEPLSEAAEASSPEGRVTMTSARLIALFDLRTNLRESRQFRAGCVVEPYACRVDVLGKVRSGPGSGNEQDVRGEVQ